jgi:hypothetical protein
VTEIAAAVAGLASGVAWLIAELVAITRIDGRHSRRRLGKTERECREDCSPNARETT